MKNQKQLDMERLIGGDLLPSGVQPQTTRFMQTNYSWLPLLAIIAGIAILAAE